MTCDGSCRAGAASSTSPSAAAARTRSSTGASGASIPTERFHYSRELYGYLAKQFTVFGQHVHIGVPSGDDALYLLHALSRYVPHFIALSASSPFLQGEDTGFESSRLNSVFAFPLSGRAPFVLTWERVQPLLRQDDEHRHRASMKDFYWDIRPKPEYGTIEMRVCDTPLTVDRAAALAGYVQTPVPLPARGAALRAHRGRLPGLHLQPLPGLPLRPRRRDRRPQDQAEPEAARRHHPHPGARGRTRAGPALAGRQQPDPRFALRGQRRQLAARHAPGRRADAGRGGGGQRALDDELTTYAGRTRTGNAVMPRNTIEFSHSSVAVAGSICA